MYLQVTNNTKQTNNQIRTTKKRLFKDVKNEGWKMSDCSIKELPEALVDTTYRGTDGKTAGTRY